MDDPGPAASAPGLARGVGLVLALAASGACGKKGPPLAPFVPIPAAVELIEAQRLGGEAYVTLTIPAANVDEHTPADLARVEIYGYTGRSAPPRPRWVELATLIGTVPVAPPPPAPGEEPDQTRDAAAPENAPAQGARVTIRDTLTPDELVQGKTPPIAERDARAAEAGPPGTEGEPRIAERARVEPPLKRFYTAVPFNAKGRPGPPGGVAEFALLPAPDPPPDVTARYSERAVTLAWQPSGGLIGFLFERTLPEEPPPVLEEDDPEGTASADAPGPPLYHVYREFPPDALAPPGPRETPAWQEEAPAPLTPAPLPVRTFTDTVEFGRRRCYTVRAVRGVGPDARVGDASPPACLTPVDVFPPAPPQSLATVGAEGAISLIWEPNTELDLGGYVVLRGEAPGATLHPITSAPLAAARYRDESVTPGVRYVYAVIAVDNRSPVPNMSVESGRVEETAR